MHETLNLLGVDAIISGGKFVGKLKKILRKACRLKWQIYFCKLMRKGQRWTGQKMLYYKETACRGRYSFPHTVNALQNFIKVNFNFCRAVQHLIK